MYPTWLVVRDHVPVEEKNTRSLDTPNAELESDVEKTADVSTIILPEEKEKFAAAQTTGIR